MKKNSNILKEKIEDILYNLKPVYNRKNDDPYISNEEYITQLLKKNKIPLVVLNDNENKVADNYYECKEFKEIFQEEQNIYNGFRKQWNIVKEAFDKNGIETIFIKSIGLFDYKSSNLDILIKQDKRKLAEKCLFELGYIQLHNVEEPFKTLFRKFENGESISVIHLHNKVAWINPFHDENMIWKNYETARMDKLVNVPSFEDSILILTAHWFYEDKELCISDIIKISYCLEHEIDWEYIEKIAKEKGWIEGLYFGLLVLSFLEEKILSKKSLDFEKIQKMQNALPKWMRSYLIKNIYTRKLEFPFKLPKIYGKSLHYLKTVKDETTNKKIKIKEIFQVTYSTFFVVLFYKFNFNIRYQPSMLITFSGQDGSGKSLYAEHFLKTLKFCEVKTNYFWSRIGSSDFIKIFTFIIKYFKRIFEFGKIKNKNDSNENEHRRILNKNTNRFYKFIALALFSIEISIQQLLKVRIPLLMKKVVVCDRYSYDHYVDITVRYGISLKSIEGKIFRYIIDIISAKPDLSFIFTAKLNEIVIRKNLTKIEFQIAELQKEAYEDIAKQFKMIQIETDKIDEIDSTKNKIIEISLKKFYEKWHK